ncbi:MAG: hypothetical protein KGL39_49125, partial [Patescibacteria group bacterium]|nr:hypothetical protein [Patescibacteria group bacterium]
WAGDISGHNNDHSAADLALCNLLAFYCGCDPVQMDRLFRQSGLMRSKWDDPSGEMTYGERTITEAIRITGDTYEPPQTHWKPAETNSAGTRQEGDHGAEDSASSVPYHTPPLTIHDPVPFVEIDILRACIQQEEYGDGRLLAQLFEDRLVFDHGRKRWLLWQGHYWQADRTKKVNHLIGGILAAVYLRGVAECEKKIAFLEAQKEENEDAAAEIARYRKLIGQFVERAQGLRTRKRMTNVLAQAEAFLPVSGDEWDQQPALLAVSNGVINLETGELQAGRPLDYLCQAAPTPWLGLHTPAPRWEKYLAEMFAGRPELPPFMQRLCGYGMRGDTPEHRLPILYGERGRNGKDVFIGTLEHTLGGDLSATMNKEVLVSGRRGENAEPHLVSLQGKRLAWVNETNEHAAINAGQVKLITGGGRITARPLYGAPVSFLPSHLIWLITNHLPHGSADDEALWSRLLCIECKERFIDNPNPLDPHEHPRDPHLGKTLQTEASGILAWLVRGHQAWLAQGLQPPDEVLQSTAAYKAAQDDIALFVAEVCTVAPHLVVRAGDLYDAYRTWMGPRGALSGKAFGERMKKKFPQKRMTAGVVYQGLKIAMPTPEGDGPHPGWGSKSADEQGEVDPKSADGDYAEF